MFWYCESLIIKDYIKYVWIISKYNRFQKELYLTQTYNQIEDSYCNRGTYPKIVLICAIANKDTSMIYGR